MEQSKTSKKLEKRRKKPRYMGGDRRAANGDVFKIAGLDQEKRFKVGLGVIVGTVGRQVAESPGERVRGRRAVGERAARSGRGGPSVCRPSAAPTNRVSGGRIRAAAVNSGSAGGRATHAEPTGLADSPFRRPMLQTSRKTLSHTQHTLPGKLTPADGLTGGVATFRPAPQPFKHNALPLTLQSCRVLLIMQKYEFLLKFVILKYTNTYFIMFLILNLEN
jgi:hypothetical protein